MRSIAPFNAWSVKDRFALLAKVGTNSYKCYVLSTNGAEHKFTYRCVGWKSNCRTVAVENQTIEGNLWLSAVLNLEICKRIAPLQFARALWKNLCESRPKFTSLETWRMALTAGRLRTGNYFDEAYWDNRYTRDSGSFDWYQQYAGLAPLIKLYTKTKDQVLMVGCGSARMHFPRPFTSEIFKNFRDEVH